MKKIAILILPALMCFCKKENNYDISNKRTDIEVVQTEKTENIIETVYYGNENISKAEFIKNIAEHIENSNEDYKNEIDTENSIISKRKKGLIKQFKVNSKLNLEIIKEDITSKFENDINIILQTKINNIIADKIVFYKYQKDLNFPEDQSFSVNSYLNKDLVLFQFSSFFNFEEGFSVNFDEWKKYKINVETGKIKFEKKLNYLDNIDLKKDNKNIVNLTNSSIVNKDNFINISKIEEYNSVWKANCNNQLEISFTANGVYFSFPYPDTRFYTNLKKIDKNKYELYFSAPPITPIPENLDWKNFDDNVPCAIMIVNNKKADFLWKGFFNKKKNKFENIQNPFNKKITNSILQLNRCE